MESFKIHRVREVDCSHHLSSGIHSSCALIDWKLLDTHRAWCEGSKNVKSKLETITWSLWVELVCAQ